MVTRSDCEALDQADPLREMRRRFVLPPHTIYLDGNSLGPMPHGVQSNMAWHMDIGWGVDLITSWNKHHWFSLPSAIATKVGRLIGAGEGNTTVADTISVNLFKLLSAALTLRPGRKTILSDTGNFPSDLYVAQGLSAFSATGTSLVTVAPESVAEHITTDVAVVMLTEVDYRSSRKHNMVEITALAHRHGCLVIWDLSHSAGAVPVDLLGADADFAVGCTYKYLNGGPGAPAFLFVHPRHQVSAMPALVGWWGHARPFQFDPAWQAAEGVTRFQCGTQPILSLVALDAAMAVWETVDMAHVARKSQSLCRTFIDTVEQHCAGHGLVLAGPRQMSERGSHVSFHCPDGYAVMQAMIDRKVIGDFRAPDLIRFGFAPLYNSHVEAFDAAVTLADVLTQGVWKDSKYHARKAVT